MSKSPSDLTRAPDLSHERRTGPFRTQRPIYVDLLPPCNHACPAGENIQAWLGAAQGGRFEEAWRILAADNPLPAVHGRVCYHPCEDSCNRTQLDSAVSIHAVERFLGDAAIEHGWRFERTAEPRASACWWSAPGRRAFRPPTTSPASGTRSRSAMPARWRAA